MTSGFTVRNHKKNSKVNENQVGKEKNENKYRNQGNRKLVSKAQSQFFVKPENLVQL